MPGDPGYGVHLYNVPATGAAPLLVRGTRFSRQAEIIEDGSANAGVGQGLIYWLPDPLSPDSQNPNWLGPFQIEPQTEPLKLGDVIGNIGGMGQPLCNGPGHILGIGDTLGLPLIQLTSATASTTKVRVTEFS